MSRSRISLPRPARSITPAEPDWPQGFCDLPDPPEALQLGGTLPSLEEAVGIVGTRFAGADALAFTRKLAARLASAGITVISGGAEGIDAAAHEGALDAGGTTVAVLATGLTRAYPSHHGELFSTIARHGALVCETTKWRQARTFSFLRRNRLIAALCVSLIVVQAPARSGALSTAVWAKRLKRRLFAVPAAPWDPRGEGCLRLLREGARICTSGADVLSLRACRAGQVALAGLGSDEESSDDAHFPRATQRVLELLGKGSLHPDELAERLDMPAAGVQEALLILELAGRVEKLEGGLYATTLD